MRARKFIASGFILSGLIGTGMACTPDEAPPVQKQENGPEASADEQIKLLNVRKSKYVPEFGSDGQEYTAVTVTVKNDSTTPLSVNPFNFSVTDVNKGKHQVYVTGERKELKTLTLNPGEKTTGQVTFEGTFEPKILNMSGSLIEGENARAEVQ